ncbi:MAG: cytochrome c oxidase subunit I [Acidimicrobiales bacterium]
MTTIAPPDLPVAAFSEPHEPPRSGLLEWLTSTDHKVIGKSYVYTSFVLFLLSGLMAELLRTQLATPDNHFLGAEAYNQIFTIHGTLMMFMFAVPLAFGFGNYFVPLMIGAPDVSFPRLNALSYWLYLFGAGTVLSGFVTASGPADFSWIAYAPLSDAVHAPGIGADLWIIGIGLAGIGTTLGAVNLITTILTLRAPGMTTFRMPVFVWDMLVTSVLVIMAFPVLTSALALLYADRHLGTHIFDGSHGGMPILWQHLFWFFGHPEVYIIVLPYFGIATQIFPVFSRRPVFGYKGLVLATLLIGGLSMGVWAHHFFTYGGVVLPYFSAMSLLIAVPTGIKYFNWIGSIWGGQVSMKTPMLWCIGFLVTFLIGGMSGVILAMPALNFSVHDTYFVVAHFHYVLFTSSVFVGAGAAYYWLPKMTGRMLRESWGKVHFWLTLVGFNLTFFPQHQAGLRGMVRRITTYGPGDHVTFLNQLSTLGAYILGISVLPFLWNLWISWRDPIPAGDDPWGGHTLEWATTSPPPPHNFTSLPPIRSDRPLWDANQPRPYVDFVPATPDPRS